MIWVCADAEMETFLSGDLDEIPIVSISLLYILMLSPSDVRVFTYLLAQMRAASRASELSCSYSLEMR